MRDLCKGTEMDSKTLHMGGGGVSVANDTLERLVLP